MVSIGGKVCRKTEKIINFSLLPFQMDFAANKIVQFSELRTICR